MPTPWNRKAVNVPGCSATTGGAGCDVLLDGAVELAAGIARALNAGTPKSKVPMFSNPASFVNNGGKTNPPKPAPIWLDEAKLVTALSDSSWQINYEFMRAELLASTGQLQNLLRESKLGLAAGVHVYYQQENKSCVPNATAAPPVVCALEDPTPHIAAFLLFRQEFWFFFGSTGWLDQDWAWSKLYDTLSACGKPVDTVPQGGPKVFTRKYSGCVASVDCTNTSVCTASVKDGKGRDVLGKGALQWVTGGTHSRSTMKSDDDAGLAPQWEPTFNMALSTTVMPCNNAELMSSGPNWGTIRGYGLIDIDWSNVRLTVAASGAVLDAAPGAAPVARTDVSPAGKTKVDQHRSYDLRGGPAEAGAAHQGEQHARRVAESVDLPQRGLSWDTYSPLQPPINLPKQPSYCPKS